VDVLTKDERETMSNHERVEVITPKTRVPLAIVSSSVGLAIYGTILYARMMAALNGALTIQQAQDWIDNAREKNPAIEWPRIPQKRDNISLYVVTNYSPILAASHQ